MPNDIPDWTQQVTVNGGTVNVGSGNVTVIAGQNGVNISIDSPPQLLATITSAGGIANGSAAVTPPANATGILVVPTTAYAQQNSGNMRMKVTGGVSGYVYFNLAFSSSAYYASPIECAVAGAADAPFTVLLGGTDILTTGTVIGRVYALLGAGMQQVYTNQGQPLYVLPLNQDGTAASVSLKTRGTGAFQVITMDGTTGNGVITNLRAAGLGNFTVWYTDASLVFPTANIAPDTIRCILRTTSGTRIRDVALNVGSTANVGHSGEPVAFPWGFSVTNGDGLEIITTTNQVGNMIGTRGVVWITTP